MIDFRYHLVSLISVFLALAVGIALGAGPLKETIGDTLTGQVDQLRVEKEQLRAELDAATADLTSTEAAFAAAAPALLDGVLGERRIAVVELGDVRPEALDQVRERIGQAGGSVSATVQVTDKWNDPAERSFRQSLAGSLLEYLDPAPAQDAGTGTELAEALAQALTTSVPTEPDVLSEDAGLILELLSEAGLVVLDGDVTAPADAIVLLAGPTVSVEEVAEVDPSENPEEATADAELLDAQIGAAMQIATAAQARSAGAVVAGGELTEPSLVERIRADETTVSTISTVESVHVVVGQVSVPLALSASIGGTVGHYGPSADATAAFPPRVVLTTIIRVAQEPVTPPADAGASTETQEDAATGTETGQGTDQG